MNKELLILRHGKADVSDINEDFQRPLVSRGKRGAQQIGVWLQQQNLIPDFILSSPAIRALDTAKYCCHAMGLSSRHIYREPLIYQANVDTLMALIAACPSQAQRLLLVGHNPGLEDLLRDLTTAPLAEVSDEKCLPTAALAYLTLTESWSGISSGCGQLNSITPASSLGGGFPFAALSGSQFRPRPAYYYQQSSVIAYGVIEAKFKILLVSNYKQEWSLPKGVIEPGVTPQLSAAQSAWEEAGVEGVISDEPIGYYYRQKWDGLCTIAVFPMAVTNANASPDWLEHHRQRQWFTAKQAQKVLNEPRLTQFIQQLLVSLKYAD
jgi:phosphohistidine phosphatase